MKNTLKLSIRQLVELVLRSGDIDHRYLSNRRALEGIRLHQQIQNKYPESFKKEVRLCRQINWKDYSVQLEGRADGIEESSNKILIDEIKSTLYSEKEIKANPNLLHWAQLKCYGWILCENHKIENLTLRLTYIQLESEKVFHLEEIWTREDLELFIHDLLKKYWKIQEKINTFSLQKQKSLKDLTFPYPSFRKGQRKLAVATYNMIQKKETLLVQAPTGIGKTMATLFPSIKSMEKGLTSLIFYGTSRSTQKNIVRDAHYKLFKQGLRIKSLVLTSKEKICMNEQVHCNPKECPYAKGHFDRIFQATCYAYDSSDIFDRKFIQSISQKYHVCPFELQLDLSNYCDLIIGDYNYIFHPKSKLDRLQSNSKKMKDTTLLIDEAHNLIDRARDMYSIYLDEEILTNTLSSEGLSKSLQRRIIELYEVLLEILSIEKTEYSEVPDIFERKIESLRHTIESSLSSTKEEPTEELLHLYFHILDWQDLLSLYNHQEFVIYVSKEKRRVSILCLDPSSVLSKIKEKFGALVFFSATLKPFQYHAQLFGVGPTANFLDLPSPFNPSNFLILHPSHIATTYKHRNQTLKDVARYMEVFTNTHEGNYMFFFPSYDYLEKCLAFNKNWDLYRLVQEKEMTESQRESFIQSFQQSNRVHGYAVMGGVFSEGIDLVGDALEGAVIVSIALPGINRQRDLIKKSFQKKGLPGFDFAYTIPGIIKVLQAAGRIIRDEKDKGVLLLLDRRFSDPKIRQILPAHWEIKEIRNLEELKNNVENFWR